MKKIDTKFTQTCLFREHFNQVLNPKNSLLILAQNIDWKSIEKEIDPYFPASTGAPHKPIRLVVGLLMLQHMFNFSDEKTGNQWLENPYWQYFTGYGYLQWEAPLEVSSLTRWRQRLGEEGLSKLLAATISDALKKGVIKRRDLEKVIADTTVMEKNITYPTDTKLLQKVHSKLLSFAKKHSINLRQSYKYTVKKLAILINYEARSRAQNGKKKLKSNIKKLKNKVGCVFRDIKRKASKELLSLPACTVLLAQADHLINRTKVTKNKLFSLHAPEVYCMCKGKLRNRYEFGSKVSLVVTHRKGLVLSSQALEKPLHDSATLSSSLSKAESLSGGNICTVFVDRGYRGHKVKDKEVCISGQKKDLSPKLKKDLRHRSSIEPHIGHMKSDGKLGRNFLKGMEGDKANALLSAVGHNLRLLLAHLMFLP